MNLTDAQIMATKLMEQHGLIEIGWTFQFDNAKRRFGYCSSRWRTISLSKPLTELNDENHVRMTMLHEIAHALVGQNHHHDKIWRTKCIEIGGDGERCYPSTVIEPEIKHRKQYVATCMNCKRTVYRNRKRFGMACGICCNKFNGNKWSDDYLFNWEIVRGNQ